MSEMRQYAGTSPSTCRHSPGMLKGSRGRSGACFLVLVCLFSSFPAMPRILLQKGPLALYLHDCSCYRDTARYCGRSEDAGTRQNLGQTVHLEQGLQPCPCKLPKLLSLCTLVCEMDVSPFGCPPGKQLPLCWKLYKAAQEMRDGRTESITEVTTPH